MTDPSSSTSPPPTMEAYLSSVKDVVTEATGEKGVGAKIMSNVQDCMSLDAIKRIQEATELVPIANAMAEHLSHKEVCACGLAAILKMWKPKEGGACSTELAASNGIEIVLTCMENHIESAIIQKRACNVLVKLFAYCSMDAWTGGVRTFHFSPRGIKAIVAAVQRYPKNVGVQKAAMSTFHPLQHCAICHSPRRGRHAKYLINAGGLPLLFSVLERHNTSFEVVIGALIGIQHIVSDDGFYNLPFSNYAEYFRIIEDAESTMARMYPDDIMVAREASIKSTFMLHS
jgi:hypothetical protein